VLVPRFRISGVSWRDAALTLVPFVLLLLVVLWVTLHFVNPAPPTTIVMTSGADVSMFQVHAGRYAKILAKQGVTLKILPSQGSLENLKRQPIRVQSTSGSCRAGSRASATKTTSCRSAASSTCGPLFYMAPQPISSSPSWTANASP
jgi:hypothetical protein